MFIKSIFQYNSSYIHAFVSSFYISASLPKASAMSSGSAAASSITFSSDSAGLSASAGFSGVLGFGGGKLNIASVSFLRLVIVPII